MTDAPDMPEWVAFVISERKRPRDLAQVYEENELRAADVELLQGFQAPVLEAELVEPMGTVDGGDIEDDDPERTP